MPACLPPLRRAFRLDAERDSLLGILDALHARAKPHHVRRRDGDGAVVSVRMSRALLAASVAVFFVGAVGFDVHDEIVQPTGRVVYVAMLPIPFVLFALARLFAPRRPDGHLDGGPNAAFAFIISRLGVPFFCLTTIVFANGWLDRTPRAARDLRIVERTFSSDADDDWYYDAVLADPDDPSSVLRLHIGEAPFPDLSAVTLRVAVCPGALGIRWFCAMPGR